MNKNGFTLVELLAVIVILATVVAIAVPSVIAIQNRIQTNMYCEKISLIESAAKLYGQDIYDELSGIDNPTLVTIGSLASNAYLKKDNSAEPYVIDPRDNASMDDDQVKIYIKNKRVYVDYVTDSDICD